MMFVRTRMVCVLALVLLTGWLAVSCSPTYTPECRGDAANPLRPGELAQPSGLVRVDERVYVASAASLAPRDRLDYCGSFITPFDTETGETDRSPLVPQGNEEILGQEYFRFFAGIVHDGDRGVFYVAERDTGSVLRIHSGSGRILDRVEVGNAPYAMQWMPGVTTDATEDARDLIAVADIGGAQQPGRVWVIDAESFQLVRDLTIDIGGRPAVFDYDGDRQRLYVGFYDGVGVAVVDMTTGHVLVETEPVAEEISPTVRGVAIDPATERLFFTAEQRAFSGIWIANTETGRLKDHLTLARRPTDIAFGGGYLVALARNRLYIHDADTLALVRTEELGIETPARLLLDEELGLVYVTGFEPSELKIVELP